LRVTPEIAYVLAVGLVAVVLFVTEWIRMDQVAISVPVALLLGGVIDVEAAVSGLSNPATVTVAAMIALGLGLQKTGVVAGLGRLARRLPLSSPRLRLLAMCGAVAALSPFLSNTAVVVVFLPVFVGLAAAAGEAPSRTLIPLSYSAILGGTVTLIGTSTNLVVHNLARNRGYGELSMFSIAPLGLIYLTVGLLYMATVGRRLLPSRPATDDLDHKLARRVFTTDLVLTDESGLVGSAVDTGKLIARYGIEGIERSRRWYTWPPRRQLAPGDHLRVTGTAEAIVDFARRERLDTPLVARAENSDTKVIELLVAPGFRWVGQTLAELRLDERFGAVVLGVQHARRPLGGELSNQRLAVGDLLLVEGAPSALARLLDTPGFVGIGEVTPRRGSRPPGAVALLILAAVVAVASAGLASIEVAALVGAVSMVATRCLRVDEIYSEMDWPVLALLAGLLPFGVALDRSGAAELIASELAGGLGGASPFLVVACFYAVTSILTELMSNQVAAVVLTPIALSTAGSLDMNPYALIVAVMFGASASFMTPMGYQTNALVYGPGNYRFSDYVRIGGPLNGILAVVAALLIPLMWP
jgi:di/tricarboxylate transporter